MLTRSYLGLDARYIHVTVKHEDGGYVVKIGNEKFHTQNIENFWSVFKRGIIGIYHFVSAKHLHRYCNEFGYRYNRRELNGVEKFDSALLNADCRTLPYLKLIGRLTNAKLDSIAETLSKNPPAHPDSWLDNIDLNNLPVA